MLSPKLLDALRIYCAGSAQATDWLFPAIDAYRESSCLHQGSLERLSEAANAPALSASAFIPIPCATALPLICLKLVLTCAPFNALGHRDLEETTIYLHLSRRHLSATGSPLDALTIRGEGEQPQTHEPATLEVADIVPVQDSLH